MAAEDDILTVQQTISGFDLQGLDPEAVKESARNKCKILMARQIVKTVEISEYQRGPDIEMCASVVVLSVEAYEKRLAEFQHRGLQQGRIEGIAMQRVHDQIVPKPPPPPPQPSTS